MNAMGKQLSPLVSGRQLAGFAINALLHAPLIIAGTVVGKVPLSVSLTATGVVFAARYLVPFLIGLLDRNARGPRVGMALVRG